MRSLLKLYGELAVERIIEENLRYMDKGETLMKEYEKRDFIEVNYECAQ